MIWLTASVEGLLPGIARHVHECAGQQVLLGLHVEIERPGPIPAADAISAVVVSSKPSPGTAPWQTFAAFLDHTDDQIGRLVDYLERTDLLEDTLIVLLSDNGASQEGGRHGLTNENIFFNRQRLSVADMVPLVDEIGGPNLYNNYPWGWAQAGNTPLGERSRRPARRSRGGSRERVGRPVGPLRARSAVPW